MVFTRYHGWRDEKGAHVAVYSGSGSRPLPLRLDLDNHSPTGFEWGYGGSGPAQLALALLADALQDDGAALRLHQPFKWQVIAKLSDRWLINACDIVEFRNANETGASERRSSPAD
jgi:hypothetical protein